MGRSRRTAALVDRAATGERLAAMTLRTQSAGWVPGPVPEPSRPVADIGTARPADPAAPVGQPAPTASVLLRGWAADRLPLWALDRFDRMSLGSLLTGLATLLAAVLAGVLLLHHHSAGGDAPYDVTAAGSSYSPGPAASAAPSALPDATSIVVDVGGRVRQPGLVTLPAGARVADAIAAAGGPLHRHEVATLDLAARVTDGQLLLIGVKSAPTGAPAGTSDGSAAAGTSGAAVAPVSLSTATIDDLQTLPGVGPVTAQNIIDWRTAHNGFATVEQLQQVTGIGPAKYAELSPLVTP